MLFIVFVFFGEAGPRLIQVLLPYLLQSPILILQGFSVQGHYTDCGLLHHFVFSSTSYYTLYFIYYYN